MMLNAQFQSIARRPPVIIAGLLVLAILMFLAVTRLVHRFGEQEKALARHMFEQGQAEQRAGNPDRAIEDFRAALLYNRDDFQYQLSLAAALRDSGRTEESETYLIGLWEGKPQDGMVNRALGRLAARQGSVEKAIQYYHNAAYGVWASDADQNRLNAEFELIEFLLRANARPQAQAELITLAASHSSDTVTQLRIASSFVRAQDYEHALEIYREVLQAEPNNTAAATGAGEMTFTLGQYHAAESALRNALRLNPVDARLNELLQTTTMILQSDPFDRQVSFAEQKRRLGNALEQAGARLDACAKAQNVDLTQPNSSSSNPLSALKERWLAVKHDISGTNSARENDETTIAMDLIADIEQQTAHVCGAPSGMDEALLLLSQDRMSNPAGGSK